MTSRKCEHDPAGYVRDDKGVEYCPECPTVAEALAAIAADAEVLGYCPHGVNLDRDFCPEGCRV